MNIVKLNNQSQDEPQKILKDYIDEYIFSTTKETYSEEKIQIIHYCIREGVDKIEYNLANLFVRIFQIPTKNIPVITTEQSRYEIQEAKLKEDLEAEQKQERVKLQKEKADQETVLRLKRVWEGMMKNGYAINSKMYFTDSDLDNIETNQLPESSFIRRLKEINNPEYKVVKELKEQESKPDEKTLPSVNVIEIDENYLMRRLKSKLDEEDNNEKK